MNKEKEKIAQIEKLDDTIYVFSFKLPIDEDEFYWELDQLEATHEMLHQIFEEQGKYLITLPDSEDLNKYSLEDLKFYQKNLNEIIQKMESSKS